MDLLDTLDDARRQQDISDYVDSLPIENQISEQDAQMLLNELNSIDESKGTDMLVESSSTRAKLTNNSESSHNHHFTSLSSSAISKYRPEFQALTLLSREDGETVRRLMNELHQQQVDNQSLQLRINHLQLQNEALFQSEQQHKHELDQTLFVIATLEQDKLLLETKLRDVAGYESNSKDQLTEEMRGKLLQAANTRCEEFVRSLDLLQRESDEKVHHCDQHIQELELENQALMNKLQELSTEIAQRAVLYAAQERRMLDMLQSRNFAYSGQEKNLIETNAKLNQMEAMYKTLSQEHTELNLRHRGLVQEKDELTSQLEDSQEQVQQLQEDIAEMSSHNQSLETMLSHLKNGSELEGLESNLFQEMSHLKQQARVREESLRVQLTEAREQLSNLSNARDLAAQENERLYQENQDFRRLLHDLEAMGLAKTSSRFIQSPNYHDVPHGHHGPHDHSNTSSLDKNITMESFLLGEKEDDDENIQYQTQRLNNINYSHNEPGYKEDDGTIATEENMHEENASLTWLISPSHTNQPGNSDSNQSENNSKDGSSILFSLIQQLQHIDVSGDYLHLREDIERILNSHMNEKVLLSDQDRETLISGLMHLLTHRISVTEDTASISSDYETRIRGMKKEQKRLKYILRLVLAKAAELGVTSSSSANAATIPSVSLPQQDSREVDRDRIKALTDAVEVLTKEKQQLQDHMNNYRDEIQQLHTMMETSKEIGRHEASLTLEARAVQAEATCQHYKQLIETYQTSSAVDVQLTEWQHKYEALQRQLSHEQETIASYRLEKELAEQRVQELMEDLVSAQEDYAGLMSRYEKMMQRMSKTSSKNNNISITDIDDITTTNNDGNNSSNIGINNANSDSSIVSNTEKDAEKETSAISITRAPDTVVIDSETQTIPTIISTENAAASSEVSSSFSQTTPILVQDSAINTLITNDVKSTFDSDTQTTLTLCMLEELQAQTQTQITLFETKLTQMQALLNEKDKQIQELQSLHVEKQQSLQQELKHVLQDKENDLESLQLTLQDKETCIEDLRTQIQQSLQLHDLLIQEKAGLMQEIIVLQGCLQGQEEANRSLQEEILQSTKRVTLLQQEVSSLQQIEKKHVLISTDISLATSSSQVLLVCDTNELQDKENLLQTQIETIQQLQNRITHLTNDLQAQQTQIEHLQEEAKSHKILLHETNNTLVAEKKDDPPASISSPNRDAAKYCDSKENSFLYEHNNSVISFLEIERDDLILKLDALIQENHRLQAVQSSLHDKLHDINVALQETETHAQERISRWQGQEQQIIDTLHSVLVLFSPSSIPETVIIDRDNNNNTANSIDNNSTINNHNIITNLLSELQEHIIALQRAHQAQETHHKQTLLDAKQIITVLENELQRERALLAKKDNKHKHALQKLQQLHDEELSRVEMALRSEFEVQLQTMGETNKNTLKKNEENTMISIEENELRIAQLQESFDQERLEMEEYFTQEMQRIRDTVAALQLSYETQIRNAISQNNSTDNNSINNTANNSENRRDYKQQESKERENELFVAPDKIETSFTTAEVKKDVSFDGKISSLEEEEQAKSLRFSPAKQQSPEKKRETSFSAHTVEEDRDVVLFDDNFVTSDNGIQDKRKKERHAKEQYLALVKELETLQLEFNAEKHVFQTQLITFEENYALLQAKYEALLQENETWRLQETMRKESMIEAGVNTEELLTANNDNNNINNQKKMKYKHNNDWSLSRTVTVSIPPLPTSSSKSPEKETTSNPKANNHVFPMKDTNTIDDDINNNNGSTAVSLHLPPAADWVSVTDVRTQLTAQKQRLLQKYAQRLLSQQKTHQEETEHLKELFATEKQSILRMVRQECQEILHETQRLLLAKRELALYQQHVNDVIAELAQRPSVIAMSHNNHHSNNNTNSNNRSFNTSMSPIHPDNNNNNNSNNNQNTNNNNNQDVSTTSSFLLSTPSLLPVSPLIQQQHYINNINNSNTRTPTLPFPSFPTATPTATTTPPRHNNNTSTKHILPNNMNNNIHTNTNNNTNNMNNTNSPNDNVNPSVQSSLTSLSHLPSNIASSVPPSAALHPPDTSAISTSASSTSANTTSFLSSIQHMSSSPSNSTSLLTHTHNNTVALAPQSLPHVDTAHNRSLIFSHTNNATHTINHVSSSIDVGQLSRAHVHVPSHPTLAASVAVSTAHTSSVPRAAPPRTPPHNNSHNHVLAASVATPKLYPEMLSPAVTRALVQQVYDRSITEDDPYRALQLHSSFPRKK